MKGQKRQRKELFTEALVEKAFDSFKSLPSYKKLRPGSLAAWTRKLYDEIRESCRQIVEELRSSNAVCDYIVKRVKKPPKESGDEWKPREKDGCGDGDDKEDKNGSRKNDKGDSQGKGKGKGVQDEDGKRAARQQFEPQSQNYRTFKTGQPEKVPVIPPHEEISATSAGVGVSNQQKFPQFLG